MQEETLRPIIIHVSNLHINDENKRVVCYAAEKDSQLDRSDFWLLHIYTDFQDIQNTDSLLLSSEGYLLKLYKMYKWCNVQPF